MLRPLRNRLFPPCDRHEWRDIYGDEITWMNARSVCEKCGKRSPHLMQETRHDR